MIETGRIFYKMTGSGNDFIFVDAIQEPASELKKPERIRALCARRTGIGADGLVLLESDAETAFRMSYFNRDGSAGAMCGNAALCATRLGTELGVAAPEGFSFETDCGHVTARLREGQPEIDLQPVHTVSTDAALELEPGERRIGFTEVGVPHLVLLCEDVDAVDPASRGAQLRSHPRLADGANVNFVSSGARGWRYRTYERGVEGETLACGTGAIAAAILLAEWALAGPETVFTTRSGLELGVRLARRDRSWYPSLSGEGRLVFIGAFGEL